MSSDTGMIFNIQRFSVNDGPGIRTTVFFKGCPLKCPWCHNPESHRQVPETVTEKGVTTTYGRTCTVDEVMAEVLRDHLFYETSGGGITLSGGEPLAQPAFALALLTAAKKAGLHTAVETSGFFHPEPADDEAAPTDRRPTSTDKRPTSTDRRPTFDRLLAVTDLFLYDYKVSAPDAYEALIGLPEETVLQNLERIDRAGIPVILRCPIIPGVNNRMDHFRRIGVLTKQYSCIQEVQIEPYHNLGEHKYEALGRAVTRYRTPSDRESCRLDSGSAAGKPLPGPERLMCRPAVRTAPAVLNSPGNSAIVKVSYLKGSIYHAF